MFKSLFGTGKPNIERLKKNKDAQGLINALEWAKQRRVEAIKLSDNKTKAKQAEKEAVEVVLGAMQALAEIGDPQAIKPIIAAFEKFGFFSGSGSPNPNDFCSVIISRFGQAAIDPLIERIGCTWAQAALGWIGSERASSSLIKNYDSYGLTIWALGQIGGKEASSFFVSALLGKNLQELYPNPRNIYGKVFRDKIVLAFGSGKFDSDQEARDVLADALAVSLNKVDDRGRFQPDYYIAGALCMMGDVRGLEIMLRIWEDPVFSHVDRPYATYSLLAIARCNDIRARQFLVSQIEKYTDSSLRTVGRNAHGEYDISSYHLSDIQENALFAALALAKLGNVRAVGPLVDVFANPIMDSAIQSGFFETSYNPGTKATYCNIAKKALIDLGDVASSTLINYFTDPDSNVAYQAQEIVQIYNEKMLQEQ